MDDIETVIIEELAEVVRTDVAGYSTSVSINRTDPYSIEDMPWVDVSSVGFKVAYLPGAMTPPLQERLFTFEVTVFGVLDGDIYRALRRVAAKLEAALVKPIKATKLKSWRLKEAGPNAMTSIKTGEGQIAGYTLFYEAVAVTQEGDATKSLIKGP